MNYDRTELLDCRVEGGFMQACHGEETPLKWLDINDWVIYYSPKLQFEGKQKCQAFTAIGQVIGASITAHDMGNEFVVFRRAVHFLECQDASILPLVTYLNFIKNKQNWGYCFRTGLLEVQKVDFDLIWKLMLPG